MKKALSILFSSTAAKIACSILILASIISAVSEGIEGKYSEMHNHINWTIWISLVVALMIVVENRTEENKSKDAYIEALESYKTLTDDHIVSLKELIEAYKSRCEGLEEQIENYRKLTEMNEAIIEQYKSNKPSRF